MNLLQKLKAHCLQKHLQVRASEFAACIMDGSLSKAEYSTLLLANYVFHIKLEQQITQQLPFHWKRKLAWEERHKAKYAKLDLVMLQQTELIPELLNSCRDVTYQINTPSEALGALYVVEGTAIGGAIIKKHLLKIDWIIQQKLDIRFYGCYGNTLSAKWKTFTAFVQQVEATHEEALQQAYQTFMLYEELLAKASNLVEKQKKAKTYRSQSLITKSYKL